MYNFLFLLVMMGGFIFTVSGTIFWAFRIDSYSTKKGFRMMVLGIVFLIIFHYLPDPIL